MENDKPLPNTGIPLQCTVTPGEDPDEIYNNRQDVESPLKKSNSEKDESHSDVEMDYEPAKRLFYKVSENPPWHLTVFFALQQALLFVAMNLSVTVLVSELVCARDDELLKTQIFSSTLMMSGLATFLVTTLGVRLPIYQGPASAYIVPLVAMKDIDEWRCPSENELELMYANSTVNLTMSAGGKLLIPREYILPKLQSLQGSLMLAGCIHVLIATTGLIGFLLRFIGPITIVPAITLIGLSIYKVAVTFSETQWGVAFVTSGVGMLFAFYLGGRNTPIPAWTRKRGFHIIWYPLHQMFAVASRRVFQVLGIMLVLFSVINKGGAIFITIPYSVIGGNNITTFGLFIGIVLSNLQFVDLKSNRNLAIIGFALFIGMLIPSWIETKPEQLDTGNEAANRILRMLLSSTIFVGGCVACFLDNTVPGTIEERGLHWGQPYGDGGEKDNDVINSDLFEEGVEVYDPLFIPKFIKKSRFARFISIIPDEYTEREKRV
ncbi:solute carrier family 23 member 1-like isoform X2 [Gigantopelta aegis]|uniref:solute carrier family 23 member 1-like isoform X2 n=1 Tax=Gigantopelta aegis TaxID=1735272 RepID=UPI001B88A3EF|nr:solute carrier family 23 member 1-like isoform X2 [Gigantopelta aegis]